MHSRKRKKQRRDRTKKERGEGKKEEHSHLEEQVKIIFMNFSLKRNRSEDKGCGT